MTIHVILTVTITLTTVQIIENTNKKPEGGLLNFLFEPWDAEFKMTHKFEDSSFYLISKNAKMREGWTSAIGGL